MVINLRRALPVALAVLLVLAAGFFFLGRGGPAKTQSLDPMENEVLANLSGNYDTTANITYRDMTATAVITQQSPQSCEVVFTSPPSLKDMGFSFRQDQVEVSYKGLSFGFDPASMPGTAVAKTAVSAINAALQKEGMELSYQDGALQVSGTAGFGDFSLLLDPTDGNLLKLSVPDQQLEIEFENFTFL